MSIMKKFALLALFATSASAFAFSPRATTAAVGSSTHKLGGAVPPASKTFAK
jgi:hypothetical protein